MTENPGKLERINQISRSSPTTPANYVKFAESAPMTSRLGVNQENSRKVQRMTQILHLSHNATANNAKFATFAHKYKLSNLFLTHFAHVLLHIFCIYAHILHHCRLVLSSSDLPLKLYLTINVNVCYPPPVISGPIALFTPITPQKKKKKKNHCRYTRLQPKYCQLIALTSNILSLAKSLIGISAVMLTPCLSFSTFQRPPAFLASY